MYLHFIKISPASERVDKELIVYNRNIVPPKAAGIQKRSIVHIWSISNDTGYAGWAPSENQKVTSFNVNDFPCTKEAKILYFEN